MAPKLNQGGFNCWVKERRVLEKEMDGLCTVYD
jgi:hypothetical protein